MFEVLAIEVVLVAAGVSVVVDPNETFFCADFVVLIDKSLFCTKCFGF